MMALTQLQRWPLILVTYQKTIIHWKGSSNGNADAFSRLPLKNFDSDRSHPADTTSRRCD